nr:F-box/FBD/LRR-repeat protein At1g13570-like [Ipomoea batatas]
MASCRRRKSEADAGRDVISELPSEVKERILECLPTRDAARTALLSTHWNHVWLRLGRLVFHQDFFECFSKYEGEKGMAQISTINDILMLRAGPVKKFVLHLRHASDPKPQQSDLDRWCRFLSRNNENKTVEIFVEHVVDDQWDYEVEMTYISDEVRMMNEIYANAIATPLSLGEGPSNFVAAMRRKDIKFVKNEGRRYENKIINSGFLAKFYKDEFRLNTSWGRMVFQEHVKAKFNCQLSMHQSYRAKKQALKYLEGSEGLNYSAKFQNGQAQAAEIEVGRNEAEFEKEDAFENVSIETQVPKFVLDEMVKNGGTSFSYWKFACITEL